MLAADATELRTSSRVFSLCVISLEVYLKRIPTRSVVAGCSRAQLQSISVSASCKTKKNGRRHFSVAGEKQTTLRPLSVAPDENVGAAPVRFPLALVAVAALLAGVGCPAHHVRSARLLLLSPLLSRRAARRAI